MTRRLLAVVVLAGATGLLAVAQQPTVPIDAARKERLSDPGTPGVLLPLRTEAVERPVLDGSIDTTTLPVLPDIWETDPATGARYRRGQLLVRYRHAASASARALALQRSGSARIATMPLPDNWELVAVPESASLADTAAALMRTGAADQVSLNYEVKTLQVRPNDERYSIQWNFDAIGMPFAWQINPGGRNDVIVAVIDTGLNTASGTYAFRHPLGGTVPLRFGSVPDLVADGRIVSPFDFIYNDTTPLDLVGHGTHVAGTIAQQTNNNVGVAGIAYNVKIMPLKVLPGVWEFVFGIPPVAGTTGGIAGAIRYAADHDAKVINLSLGADGPTPTVRDAIQYAVGKGAFVAIAAGNSAEDGNGIGYPAAYAPDIQGVMAVGAVNRSLKRARYSTFHDYVEICAPGGEVVANMDFERGVTQVTYDEASTLALSLDPSTALRFFLLGFRPVFDRFELAPYQGTSMATPHISGVAALLYSQGIRNPAAIEQAIKRFATPLGLRADECGAGLVDARRTLRGLGLGR
jgi:serine protease